MFIGYDVNLYKAALKTYNGDETTASSKAYRQFFLDNVLAFMSGGKVYDFRKENEIMERYGEQVYNQLTPSMIKALKNEIDMAEESSEESSEPIEESFKKKKILNLNQFKFLVKRIIKEEKDNLNRKYENIYYRKSI
jgi:hypothetical protein